MLVWPFSLASGWLRRLDEAAQRLQQPVQRRQCPLRMHVGSIVIKAGRVIEVARTTAARFYGRRTGNDTSALVRG